MKEKSITYMETMKRDLSTKFTRLKNQYEEFQG